MSDPRDLPPLNALRAFEATARLGGMSRAGDKLHVTHGAVSRQIRALEEQLGVALFRREGRGLALTEAGLRLREVSGEVFERLREVCAELKAGSRQGPFVLGCPGSLVARWFIPRLDRLNRDLPELRLHLSTRTDDTPLAAAGLDASLLFTETAPPQDVMPYHLAPERIGPVLSPYCPAYLRLRDGDLQALLAERLLHTLSRPQAWPQWFATQGLEAPELEYGQGFEHLYYLLEAALSGLGVAIAPEPLVAADLKAGRLVAPWGFAATGAELALWAPGRLADERVERLAAWLRTELAER